MNQEPDRFDPMTGQPLQPENSYWKEGYQANVEIAYEEASSSGALRKKLIGLGTAAVLVAGLCVFLLFFFKPTDTEYILSAAKSTFNESGKEFQLSEAGDLLDKSMNDGTYMLEVNNGDEYLKGFGFYVDAGAKQLLLKAEGDKESFLIYLDDEEISLGSPDEVIFMDFSEFKSKFPHCPLMQESQKNISEENVEKMDKVLTEIRALIWDAFSASPLDNKEQEANFEEFKEKIVVEKKGKKELSSQNGSVSCTVYEVSMEMDALTDFLCNLLDKSFENGSEHFENILSIISKEEVGEQFKQSRQQMFDELRRQMDEVKKEHGDKLFFDAYVNSSDRLAGLSFEWKVKEESVSIEFLCPSGNIAEEAKLTISDGGEQMVLSNSGEVSGDVFKGNITAEAEGHSQEVLNYEYNIKNGEFCFRSEENSGEELRGRFYVNKEKGQVEMAFYQDGEEVDVIFGKLQAKIEKPSGKRYNLLEESSESLSQIGIMKKYLIGESYAQPGVVDADSYDAEIYGSDGDSAGDGLFENYGLENNDSGDYGLEDNDSGDNDFEDYDFEDYDFEDDGFEDYDSDDYDFDDYDFDDYDSDDYDFEEYDFEEYDSENSDFGTFES